MPSWLVQSPETTYTYIVLGLIALALAYGWWTRRQRKFLIGLAVIAGLIGLVVLLDILIESDEEQIKANLESMARNTVAKKLGPVFEHVSADFNYQGMDKQAFRAAAEHVVQRYEVTDIQVWDFKFPEVSRERKVAKVDFLIKVKGVGRDEAYYRNQAEFVLEPERHWRLKAFKLSNPVANASEEVPIPLN